MPTISQLPLAIGANSTDEVAISQGDATRGITVAALLSELQPLIVLNGAVLLGRTTAGAGGLELVTAGPGLALANGALSATGLEQASFAIQPALLADDDVILNSAGQPRRLPMALLRGLFVAGARVAIDPSGVISATGPAFLTGAGMPSQALGYDGDTYLAADTGALWSRTSGSWTSSGTNILTPEATARAAQLAPLVTLRASSTGTIPVRLTLDGTDQTVAQTLSLPAARSVMRLTGSITAQDLASGDAMIWDVAAAVHRANQNAVPALVGTASLSVFAANASMQSCNIVISADQSGAVVECVGLSGRAIDWSAALLVVIGI